MAEKYTRQELASMNDEEYENAMREMREEAEAKGKEKLKLQIMRKERLLKAVDDLWAVYQSQGDGKIKPYIKDDIERAIRAGVDTGEE